MSFLNTNKMILVRILVGINLRDDLASKICIKKSTSITQYIDYCGLLFQCFKCHKIGHLGKDCMLPFNNKHWVKKSTGMSTQNEKNQVDLDKSLREG